MAKVASPDEKDPPVGLIAVASDASEMSEHARMDAIFCLPIEVGTGFDDFMVSKGVKLTRGLWGQIAPAVPEHLRQGVQAAWIVLDATALLSKYAALPSDEGSEKHIELALDATALGLKGLGLVNAAAGHVDNAAEIKDFGILLQKGRKEMGGNDYAFVGAEGLTKDHLQLNAVAKSYLGLLETALDSKDLVADTVAWIVSDRQPNYFSGLTQEDVARIAERLQAERSPE